MTATTQTPPADTLPSDTPLDEARAWLRCRLEHGAPCPCCTQRAQTYRRTIHASMASALVVAYRLAVRDFAYLPDTLTHRQNADWAKLAYWGLIEAELGERQDGSKRTGRWCVTELGEQWALGLATVPKYARVYDGRLLALAGDPVTIHDCLGSRFDYRELMGSTVTGGTS